MRTIPLTEVPVVEPGDDVGEILLESLEDQKVQLRDGDVIVVAQTIVSRAEGKIVDLDSIEPSDRSKGIGKKINEDPRKVEVILNQTSEVLRLEHVLISETEHGFVCADAGVDSSNTEPGEVALLPEDPDASARRIKKKLEEATEKNIAVIISDSWGRPFRLGAVGFAVGISGMDPLVSLKGSTDYYGRELETTEICPPDSLAATASLEMGEASEGIPAVVIRGAPYKSGDGSSEDLLRPRDKDLFR